MILFCIESATALLALLTSIPVVLGGGWWYHDYDDYNYSSDSSSSDSSSHSHDYDDFYHTCDSVGMCVNTIPFRFISVVKLYRLEHALTIYCLAQSIMIFLCPNYS